MRRSWLIFLLCFIALTLLASTVSTRALWGLSAWAAVSPLVGLICGIIVAPQLFLKSAPNPFRRIPEIRSGVLRLIIAAAVSMAVLWFFRSRQTLWGERAALGAAIESCAARPSAVLSTFVQWALYRFMNGVFLWSAGSIMTFTSMLAGLLYTLLALRADSLVADEPHDRSERRLAAAFLLSNGFVTLFFGGGANVSLGMSLVLAFLIAELRFLRGACSFVLPTVLLAAAILCHAGAVYLVPAFLFTLMLALKSPAERKRAAIAAGSLFAVWVVLEIALPRAAAVPGPARYLLDALASSVAGLGRHGSRGFARSLWAALNALLIMGPASAVALILLCSSGRALPAEWRGIRREENRFLFVCVISGLAMLVIGSPLLDGGLRWHVFATTGPAFSWYALTRLRNRPSGREDFARTLWALVCIGVFHAVPLVIIDAVPRLAETRILALPLPPGRGDIIIAEAALEKGNLDLARSRYLASLEKNPSNAAANARLGRIEMELEEYPAAISHLLNAHELKPADPRYRFELAEALIANRWFPEAIAHLETLTTAYPESVAYWRRLGFARNNGNRYELAVVAYEKALALEPANEENVRNLVSALLNRAAELQQEKRNGDARLMYNRVIALYPADWRAYNNLAIIEMDAGNIDRALEILSETLKRHPFESSLHFNMGLALERRGRLAEALEHLRAAQELDPIYSKAPMHIKRIEQKLGMGKPGQGDSQRSPLKTP